LEEYANKVGGMTGYCIRAYARAFEVPIDAPLTHSRTTQVASTITCTICIAAGGETLTHLITLVSPPQVIPYTLAENAGLNPIKMVTELRNQHMLGRVNTGINVRKAQITDIKEENVLQPLLVSVRKQYFTCSVFSI
jgi:hypothetical protein